MTSRVMNRDVKPEVVEESEEEIDSHFLRQSIIVDASIDECYGAAADLDDYATWCRKGGMKKVKVLDRNDDGMCSKVEVSFVCFPISDHCSLCVDMAGSVHGRQTWHRYGERS